MMLAGLISAIALLLICFKVAGRKVIGHDVVFDVPVSYTHLTLPTKA